MAARVSIIGLGRMGTRFVDAARSRGHEVVAAFDLAAEPFAVTQQPALAAILHNDLGRFLAVPSDVVVISTTADGHVALLEKALAAGQRRFVVEKPFSTSYGSALRIAEAAGAAGARIVVNHGRRYCSNHRRLAELDGSAEFGRLRSVTLRMGGGSLGCLGTHYFDMCNQLFGERPQAVAAVTTTPRERNVRGERFSDPGGAVLLSYGGERRALIDAGDDVGIVGGTDFVFERGRVSYDVEGEPWRTFLRKPADREQPLSRYGLPLERGTLAGHVPPDIVEWAARALDDALSDAPAVAGIDVALGAMEVFAAARHAAATASTVRLPLAPAAVDVDYPIP